MSERAWNRSGDGNCYEATVHAAMRLNDKGVEDFKVVHGLVTGTAGEAKGIRFGHAWIELGEDTVLDAATDKVLPKALYYRAGSIDPDETYQYTFTEAAAEMLQTEHYGPWHQ